jgi:hypothetical protein
MKKIILVMLSGMLSLGFASAQDLAPSQVPSVILNNFKSSYPKATDIEWEKKGDLFNVEFELGRGADHEIWYDAAGKMVKHKEEIAKKDLPASVTSKISSDFKDYRVNDVKKITTDTSTLYTMELESRAQDWEITIDSDGQIINQRKD